MPDEAVGGRGDEHEVTPVELFFDLVFVFAITQVTRLFVQEPTWLGLLRGMLVLAAVWWAWNAFAWLTSAENIDEGGVRLAILGTTALMLGVALAVPRAFARDAILFAVAYFLVRSMHVVLSLIVRRDDSESREALLRFIPTALIGASILVIAALVGGDLRIALWIIALLIDYSGPAVIGMGQGWAVAPEHFAERYGLIILIALGESVVAIGVAANFVLNAEELLAAALGMVTVSALWWLYFDVGALFVRRSFRATRGADRARLARDAYSYLHLAPGRRDRPLCLRPGDHPAPSRRLAAHGCCRGSLRWRCALPSCSRGSPASCYRAALQTPDMGHRRARRSHPGSPLRPCARRTRARYRCMRRRGGCRSARLARGSFTGEAPERDLDHSA
jgi:low temperature requirement protein LtrA